MSSIAGNLHDIRKMIQKFSGGREVSIVAAAKSQSLEKIKEAVQAGVTVIGNNYAQEGEVLMKEVSGKVEWHFIGHIQSRKVKYLTSYHCIQSLDRIELAKALNDRLLMEKKTMSVLVEINIGQEPQKSGILAENLGDFLKQLKNYPRLLPTGLMTMPPPLEPVEDRARYFAEARELFDQYGKEYPFRHLSMGTSEDYLIAVREGTTMVRLGTVLLGERVSKK